MEARRNIYISVIIPVYGCSSCLQELYMRLVKTIEIITKDFEIIMVNDASLDNSWEVIMELSKNDLRVKGIKLSRNFGQHYAITAGIDYCIGKWIIVMDCDLQDQPEEILKLYQMAQKGFDVVLAKRSARKDKFAKRLVSKLFYRTLGYLTDSKQDETVANFGIYSQKVISQVRNLRESIRYFPTMIKWVGFNVTNIDVEHAKRTQGNSSYNFSQMLNLALDIMLAYSNKPLKLTVKLGFGVAFISFIFAGVTFVKWMNGEISILGWASLITSIWFLTGCILITLGIVGLYVGKTFEGTKNRPLYVIDEKTWE
jgi:dolichol-phosphate mannosyltransferase